MEIDDSQITSEDEKILEKSLDIINEHLEKENLRGESAEKRASILITFIGIGATIILAVAKNFLSTNFSLKILIYIFFGTIIIYLVKAIFNVLKIFSTKQIKRLTPQMANDIQNYDYKTALVYEIKWKIWEYNQILPKNTYKLFCLSRAQRNIITAIISILIMAFIIFIDKQIAVLPNWIKCFQIVTACLLILLSFFIDYIFEKFSFWEFNV